MKWHKVWRMANKGQLARSLIALWFLVRDVRTPWPPKAVAAVVLAYALSPIDLIPDFIPVLGLLDDLVLLPLGVWLVVRLAPARLWQEMLHRAAGYHGRLPRWLAGLLLVLLVWLAAVALVAWLLLAPGQAQAGPRDEPAEALEQVTVVHVADGDTVYVRRDGLRQAVAVRVHGIDAPEICQPGGRVSQQALAGRLLGQRVMLQPQGRDHYGRMLARVSLDGQDIGRWMVQQGQAWSHRYGADPGPYAAEQRQARAQALGLFAQAQPQSPRAFRQRHGPCPPPERPAGGEAGGTEGGEPGQGGR